MAHYEYEYNCQCPPGGQHYDCLRCDYPLALGAIRQMGEMGGLCLACFGGVLPAGDHVV